MHLTTVVPSICQSGKLFSDVLATISFEQIDVFSNSQLVNFFPPTHPLLTEIKFTGTSLCQNEARFEVTQKFTCADRPYV